MEIACDVCATSLCVCVGLGTHFVCTKKNAKLLCDNRKLYFLRQECNIISKWSAHKLDVCECVCYCYDTVSKRRRWPCKVVMGKNREWERWWWCLMVTLFLVYISIQHPVCQRCCNRTIQLNLSEDIISESVFAVSVGVFHPSHVGKYSILRRNRLAFASGNNFILLPHFIWLIGTNNVQLWFSFSMRRLTYKVIFMMLMFDERMLDATHTPIAWRKMSCTRGLPSPIESDVVNVFIAISLDLDFFLSIS